MSHLFINVAKLKKVLIAPVVRLNLITKSWLTRSDCKIQYVPAHIKFILGSWNVKVNQNMGITLNSKQAHIVNGLALINSSFSKSNCLKSTTVYNSINYTFNLYLKPKVTLHCYYIYLFWVLVSGILNVFYSY